MDYKVVDEAMVFVRALAKKNNNEVPPWGKFEELVRDRLNDAYDPRPKMPKEYYYAYLRVKGLSDSDARDRMGLEAGPSSGAAKKKSFWKIWE